MEKAPKQKGVNSAIGSLYVNKLELTGIGAAEVNLAVADKRVHDFEDGLEYYAALKSKCQYIITEYSADFYFSDIPVFSPQTFLERLMQDKLQC